MTFSGIAWREQAAMTGYQRLEEERMERITKQGPRYAERRVAPSPLLPRGVATGRQGADVIFYDPLSSVQSGNPTRGGQLSPARGDPGLPGKQGTTRGARPHRISALQAVARELEILSLRKRTP